MEPILQSSPKLRLRHTCVCKRAGDALSENLSVMLQLPGDRSRAEGDGRSETNQIGGSSGVIPGAGGRLGGPSFKRNRASPITGVEEVFDVQVLPGTISPHISGPRTDRDAGRPLLTV